MVDLTLPSSNTNNPAIVQPPGARFSMSLVGRREGKRESSTRDQYERDIWNSNGKIKERIELKL